MAIRNLRANESLATSEIRYVEPFALRKPADLFLERDDIPGLAKLTVHRVVVSPFLGVRFETVVGFVARASVPAVVHAREVAVALGASLDLTGLAGQRDLDKMALDRLDN